MNLYYKYNTSSVVIFPWCLISFISFNFLSLPEPVEDRTEVLRVQVQTEDIILLGGVQHFRQTAVGKLGESLSGGLEHLTAHV